VSLDDVQVTSSRWHTPGHDVDAASAVRLKRPRRSELTSELEHTLRGAVHGALLADAPVGALCSGGVDSSLITALAVERKPDLVAFGASYPANPAIDEGPAARRVAKVVGIEIDLVEITPASFRQRFVSATVHSGAPIANASAVTVAQLADRARACGVKVVLTGEGADELFGGYANLHATSLAAFLPWYARIIRSAEPMVQVDPRGALNPLRIGRAVWRVLRAALGPAPASTWMPLANSDASFEPSAESAAAYAHHDGERAILEGALLSRLDYTLCWLLNRMDKNVMQASVEARVPFLEPEVVKLALNLPLEARVGPWSKGILRDVARRVLPWSVAHRPKIPGMDFDAGDWIEEAADRRFLFDGVLRDTLEIPSEEFDRTIAAAEGVQKLRLWSAEVWCRSVFTGSSVADIEREIWR
jgi:asparagine synthase (glutamine-hydrolysing)